MIIKDLRLVNFRNHRARDVTFSHEITLITGPNGSGKTNILEAIDLLSSGKSFKAKYDYETIFNPEVEGLEASQVFDGHIVEKEFARVAGSVEKDGEDDTVEIIIAKDPLKVGNSQKTYKINGIPKRVHESGKYFATVLFCPQDLELFSGSPSIRRRFLDNVLCKTDQKYQRELSIYIKSIRQRNKVLEKINNFGKGQDELPFWTDRILESGTYIYQKRRGLVETLNANINDKYRVEYKANILDRERLEKHRDHEILAKSTLVGPHRDDFSFMLSGSDIASYGSRGQQRTAILALKVAELGIINSAIGTSPVLLLDDIFSELDDANKASLLTIIQSQQTVITSIHTDVKADIILALK